MTSEAQPGGQNAEAPGPGQSPEASGGLTFEDMARVTLDAIGDAVVVVNRGGEVIYLNKVAETMTGWSRKLALGHPVEKVFSTIDGASRQRKVSPSYWAINDDRHVRPALGSVLIGRDGIEIAIEDSAVPIHNHLGGIAGAVIVFHDVDALLRNADVAVYAVRENQQEHYNTARHR